MNKSFKTYLFKKPNRKLAFNQAYVYFLNLFYSIINYFPGFIRNIFFRCLLSKMGSHVFLDYNIYIKFPSLVEIGDEVTVNRGVEFYPDYLGKHKIIIGSDVKIAPNVKFYAAGHDLSDLHKEIGGEIKVGNHVWIGANAIILAGVHIGDDCVIGAGSIVTRNIPPATVAVGIPAKVIKTRPAREDE